MGILNTEVEITLNSATIKYYESLGYDIPRERNKWRKLTVPRGTKLLVSFFDLQKCSNIILDAECDNCGKKYKIYNENYQKTNHNGKIYCNACSKKLFNSGTNHPLYREDIDLDDRERGRLFPGYVDFIKRVLARDNYTCQCCGKTKYEVKLQVHHLDSYNWCIEKRTDDTNGITLCECCHSNFHAKYGKGNNTKEQFEEWLGNITLELEAFCGEINYARKIYCYEEDKIYNSAQEYATMHNLRSTSGIYHVCNNEFPYKTVKNNHLFWFDEYIVLTPDEIRDRIDTKLLRHNKKSVICLTTNKIYESITEGSINENVNKNSIAHCCHHRYNNALNKNGELTQWMFYDEYLKHQLLNN